MKILKENSVKALVLALKSTIPSAKYKASEAAKIIIDSIEEAYGEDKYSIYLLGIKESLKKLVY